MTVSDTRLLRGLLAGWFRHGSFGCGPLVGLAILLGDDSYPVCVQDVSPSAVMIMLFIVLARNKLRIPLEGTYSGEM